MRRLKCMLLNRCTLSLFAFFLAAVTALGINVTCAAANASDEAKPKNSHEAYAIRDPKVDPNMHPAERARVQREAVIKKRQDVRKFVQKMIEGEQGAAPGKGKNEGGGAK
jgi:hypothetical protein